MRFLNRRQQSEAPAANNPSTSLPRFCGACGAILHAGIRVGDQCPACSTRIKTLETAPATSANPARRAALEEAIEERVKQGWYLVRQHEDFAELRKPRNMNPKWAAAWLVAGVPLPGAALPYVGAYAIWHVLRKEDSVLFFVGANAQVRTEELRRPWWRVFN